MLSSGYLLNDISDNPVVDCANTERICQQNWRLNPTGLVNSCNTGGFAIAMDCMRGTKET